MAKITLDISDAVMSRVVDAFAAAYGWEPGPETKLAFTARVLKEHIKNVTASHEAVAAADKARSGAASKANSEIVVT